MRSKEENLILSVRYEIDKFSNDWNHCDCSANYLAQLISSSNTNDPTKQSIMLSTVINEILEVIYNLKETGRHVIINIHNNNNEITIDFCLSLSKNNHKLFDDFFKNNDMKNMKNMKNSYSSELNNIMNNKQIHPFICLYEIVADYEVNLSFSNEVNKNTIRVKLVV